MLGRWRADTRLPPSLPTVLHAMNQLEDDRAMLLLMGISTGYTFAQIPRAAWAGNPWTAAAWVYYFVTMMIGCYLFVFRKGPEWPHAAVRWMLPLMTSGIGALALTAGLERHDTIDTIFWSLTAAWLGVLPIRSWLRRRRWRKGIDTQ